MWTQVPRVAVADYHLQQAVVVTEMIVSLLGPGSSKTPPGSNQHAPTPPCNIEYYPLDSVIHIEKRYSDRIVLGQWDWVCFLVRVLIVLDLMVCLLSMKWEIYLRLWVHRALYHSASWRRPWLRFLANVRYSIFLQDCIIVNESVDRQFVNV